METASDSFSIAALLSSLVVTNLAVLWVALTYLT
jgi:hypothetical protein